MAVSPKGSEIYKDLFSDQEIAALFSDRAHIRSMIAVEMALAVVQGEAGVIPAEAAEKIINTEFNISPEDLSEGTAKDGIVVPTLVKLLKSAVGGDDASYVHFGATSQDILDTALVMQLAKVFDIFEIRIASLTKTLATLADQHRAAIMAARTRSQISTPTTFGLKAANWLMPLIRHSERLEQLKERVLVLSIGGASGTLSALSEKDGIATARGLAEKLGLGLSPLPWHNQRDTIVELGAYCALLSGSIAKIASDVILLSSSGIGELSIEGGGKSSTMPQKNNPALAEAIVALSKTNIDLLASLAHAMIHNHERDAAAWQIEWLTLPKCLITTGTCLNHIQDLIGSLKINSDVMTSNIKNTHGTILAEAATFLLCGHMNKSEAGEIVGAACTKAITTKTHLFDILDAETSTNINWQQAKALDQHLGLNDTFIDHTLEKIL
mgnify:CR=1 FL=1